MQVYLTGTLVGGLTGADGLFFLRPSVEGVWTFGARLIHCDDADAELQLERGTITQVLVALRCKSESRIRADAPRLAPLAPMPPPRKDTVSVGDRCGA